MHIVILILKVIGIVLLSILGIVILTLCYIMFAPITYRLSLKGDSTERDFLAGASVYDALRLFKIEVSYGVDGLKTRLKLLFGLIRKDISEEDEEPDSEEDSEEFYDIQALDDNDVELIGSPSVIVVDEMSEDEVPWDVASDDTFKQDEITEDAPIEDVTTEDQAEEDIQEEPEEDNEPKDKTPSKVKSIIQDKRTKRAISFLWTRIIKLIKRIRPHIDHAGAEFASGEPDVTGQLTGAMASCPGFNGRHTKIHPDFVSDEPYCRGEIELFGKVQVFFPVLYGLQIIFNRDCRRLYKKVRK